MSDVLDATKGTSAGNEDDIPDARFARYLT